MRIVLFTFVFISFSNIGYGQESSIPSPSHTVDYQGPYRIPPSVRLHHNGIRYQGFDLAGYQELLVMDEDLYFAEEAYAAAQREMVALRVSLDSTEQALQTSSDEIATLQTARDRLLTRWTEENRLRHIAENKPRIGSWLAWGIAAALAITTGTLLLVGSH